MAPTKKVAAKGKDPIRIGDESSGWVHEVPKEGQGAVGQIVKSLGVSWEEAEKKLGAAYGDLNAVLAKVRSAARGWVLLPFVAHARALSVCALPFGRSERFVPSWLLRHRPGVGAQG